MAYTTPHTWNVGDRIKAIWLQIFSDNDIDHEARISALEASGDGDVTGPASSVDSEVALFDGTTGKLLKRASVTGLLKAASGVLSAAVAGTDYVTPGGTETLTAKTLTSPTITDPLFGTTGVRLRIATLTLTDAQIKALPTTKISLAAAVAGRQHLVVKGLWSAHIVTPYTNLDGTLAKLRLVYGNDVAVASSEVIDSGGPGSLTDLIATAGDWTFPLHNWEEVAKAPADVVNQALQVSMDNSASGALTGGDAANTLKVVVQFMEVTP